MTDTEQDYIQDKINEQFINWFDNIDNRHELFIDFVCSDPLLVLDNADIYSEWQLTKPQADCTQNQLIKWIKDDEDFIIEKLYDDWSPEFKSWAKEYWEDNCR